MKKTADVRDQRGIRMKKADDIEEILNEVRNCNMIQKKLMEARSYEEKYGAEILPEERPLFHMTPTVGWMNDPNGFSVYKGEYHLFYQYYPYDINWGPMHWGHVKSSDLIQWERLPAALAPDEEYDAQGAFSGSAVELPDGRQLLMYTGVQGKDQTPECRQTQCIAVGDGIDYKKYGGNPVITSEQLPDGCSSSDFRDPKIWRDEKEQCYYAVAGNRTEDGSGAVLLFKSRDGFAWEYAAMLDRSENQYGRMWECPDFFELDGKTVILISPQEMRAKGLEFHNGNDVVCLTGSYDRIGYQFQRENVSAVDYGLDFYAPQTMETPDGRRVLIGWMQSWESSRFHPDGAKWAGMMTLPRELTISEGKLIQNPVRELLKYRKDRIGHQNVRLCNQKLTLPGISGRILDLVVEVRPGDGEMYQSFTMNLAENDEYITSVCYMPSENAVCIDRTDSGFRYNIVSKRKVMVRSQGGIIRFRVVMDRFSAEIFVNDGEQVLSSCLYTPQEADGISFAAEGAVCVDVEKYTISI